MRLLIIGIFFFWSQLTTFSQLPEQIHPIEVQKMPSSYYQEQAKLWRNVCSKDHPSAYLNCYLATKFSGYTDSDKKLDNNTMEALSSLMDEVDSEIPNTFEYHYLNYIHASDPFKSFKSLESAQLMSPKSTLVAIEYLAVGHFTGQKNLVEAYALNGELNNYFSAPQEEYALNLLHSITPSSIVITNGKEDTYSLLLAAGKNNRLDFTLISLEFWDLPSYRKLKARALHQDESAWSKMNKAQMIEAIQNIEDQNIQLSLTLNKSLIKPYFQNHYVQGLTLSKRSTENQQQLWESFSKTHIRASSGNSSKNYIPMLLNLNNYELSLNAEDKGEIQGLIRDIAPLFKNEQSVLEKLK